MGQIQIHNRNRFDRYVRKVYPQELPQGLFSSPGNTDPTALRVLFRASAVQDIWNAIDWGEYTPRNRIEQGGILVGNFCDAAPEGSASREIWVEVIHAIPCGQPETSRPEFLVMSAENWLQMENIRNQNNLRDGTDYVLVGWYHTHPSSLPVGFSGRDYQTHSMQFPFEYSIGAVFNPHRRIWSVYYGPSCKVASGYLCLGTGEPAAPPRYDSMGGQTGHREPAVKPSTGVPSATVPQQLSYSTGSAAEQGELYLECLWFRLVWESTFLLGPLQLMAQRDDALHNSRINKPICDACEALIRLLHSDAAIHTLVATAEIVLQPSSAECDFRIYSCDFCYDALNVPPARFRRASVGVLLVGDLTDAEKNLRMIYQLIKGGYGWLAFCDTKDVVRFRHGQIKLYTT